MIKVQLFRKRIAISLGLFLVAELLTAAPAMASSEDLTITKVAASATASDSFPFTVTKTAGNSPANIYPNGTPSVAFNLNSSNSFTKTFAGFQNASTGVVTSPNNYTITETTPSGWNAPTIVCQVTNQNLNITFNTSLSGSVSFEYTPNAASPGAHILCTFTNTRITVATLATTVSALTIPTGTAGFDSAVLTGVTAGSLTYNLFVGTCPAQASNVPIFSSAVVVSGGVVPNSFPYTFNTAGSFYWVAVFTPTGGSPITTGPCEPLTVTPAQSGTLTIIKDAQPNDPQDFHFVTQGSGLSNFDLDDDPGSSTLPNQKTFTNLAAGVPFTVTEDFVSGWATPSIQCIVAVPGSTTTFTDQLNRTFTVNLAAGANVTCTIINVKTVVPTTLATTVSALTLPTGTAGFDSAVLTGATAGSLTYNLFAGTCPAQANNVPIFTSAVTVANGTVPNSLPYTFNTAGSFYWVAVFTPTGGSPIATGPCEPLTVTPAQTGTLTIIKDAQPNDPQDFHFVTQGTGLSNFDLDDDPSSSTLSNQKTFTGLAAGVPFTVTEAFVSGWTTPSIQCIVAIPGLTTTFTDQLNRTFTVNLAAGANVTCTIINVKTPVPIKITTAVSSLTIPAGSSGNDSAIITGAVSGTTVSYNLFAGSCPAQASNVPIFTSAVTISGGIVPNSLPYTFTTAGQYYWVVVYNGSPIETGPCEPMSVTAKSTATLTVIKRLLPANGNPNKFNLIISGPPGALGSGTTANVGNLGTTGVVTIASGQNYIVSESAGAGGTSLSQYTTTFSGACSTGGLVNLSVNTSGICIITNTKKGRLKVIKKLIPANDPGKFNLKIGATIFGFHKGNGGTTGFVLVSANSPHTVGEVPFNSGTHLSNYVRTYSPVNCGAAFIIPPGGTKTCTITNKRRKKK